MYVCMYVYVYQYGRIHVTGNELNADELWERGRIKRGSCKFWCGEKIELWILEFVSDWLLVKFG